MRQLYILFIIMYFISPSDQKKKKKKKKKKRKIVIKTKQLILSTVMVFNNILPICTYWMSFYLFITRKENFYLHKT